MEQESHLRSACKLEGLEVAGPSCRPRYLNIRVSTRRGIHAEGLSRFRTPVGICDRHCDRCTLQLAVDSAENDYRAIGIAELLSDQDEIISLVPDSNERLHRRQSEEDSES